MNVKQIRSQAIDLMLLTAIFGLLAILLWPAIQSWLDRPRPGRQVRQQYVQQSGVPIDYLLYLPQRYHRQRKWPLVVFLHGAGARGQDLNRVLREGLPRLVEQGKRFDFILLSPQCPAGSCWSPETVVELIERVSDSLSVDRDRVYLTGYSMGGSGVWRTACFDPARFAAIAPLCGGGNVEEAGRLKNIPVWAFHGNKDNIVPLEATQRMVDAVRQCGGNIKFTVYHGGGHGISGIAYQEEHFFEWLFAQRRKEGHAANRSKHETTP